MMFKVHMLAFQPQYCIRNVFVPDADVAKSKGYFDKDEALCDLIFHYGQNDFQRMKNICNVSGGDVIEFNDGRLFMVQAVGFKEITQPEFEAYKQLPRLDRIFSQFYERA